MAQSSACPPRAQTNQHDDPRSGRSPNSLQAAEESAQQRNAPSAIAVLMPRGSHCFQRMDRVAQQARISPSEKARTAARLQRPTAEIEDNINQGRTAFVTADIVALRGACRYALNGEVVGAVGMPA